VGIVLDQIKCFRATDNLATVCWRSVSEPLCAGVSLQCAMAFCIQLCFDTSNNSLQSVIMATGTWSVLFCHLINVCWNLFFGNVSFIVFVTHTE